MFEVKSSYTGGMIGATATIALVFSLVSLLLACVDKGGDEPTIDTEILNGIDPASSEVSSTSLFNLPGQWTSQNWDTLSLSDLKGKVTIMAMIYTHCEYSCPLLVADMKKIHKDIPADIRQNIQFVFVSIDPKNDSPDTLAQFARAEQMESDQWVLLTGSEDDVQNLSAVLGFKYNRISPIDFAHSNLFTVFDPDGEMVFQQEGVGVSNRDLISSAMEYAGETIWHVKAIHPKGQLIDVKAIDEAGNRYDVKAVEKYGNLHVMDIKAFVNGERLPVKMLVSDDAYAPVKAIGEDGSLFNIKAVPPDGNRLDVKGISRYGNIIDVKAVTSEDQFYGIKAISPKGIIHDIKGIKMSSENVEMVLNGVEVHAHIKALPQVQSSDR